MREKQRQGKRREVRIHTAANIPSGRRSAERNVLEQAVGRERVVANLVLSLGVAVERIDL